MQSYISHRHGRVSNPQIIFFFFFVISCFIDLLQKNIGNYRKYDIFFNFCFTENIFPSVSENYENMIFTLSVFTKMLFFIQWNDLRTFNQISRKDVNYDNIRSHKKSGLYVLSREYIFGKTGEGVKWSLHPS